MTNQQQEQLKKFFMTLERISHSPGELYDLGLVVSNEIKIDDLIKILKEYGVKAESLILSENTPGTMELKNTLKTIG